MDFSDNLKSQLTTTAHALADAAAVETLRYFRGGALATESKIDGGYDPVTVADRAAEAAMRAVLAELRPDDAILGEEFANTSGTTGLTWVLDPIDGTRGYVSGSPTWGTLIAVGPDNGPVLGIVDQPFTQERFVGGFGHASLHRHGQRQTLKTRAARPLSEAILFSTYPEVGSDAEGRAFHKVAAQAQLTRYGTDCYAYALLAAGQIDLVIEAGLAPYDIQGPLALVEAAGGLVTSWDGGPAHAGGSAIAAANADIHAKAIAILQHSMKT